MNPKVRKITKVVLRFLFWTIVITAICTTYFTGKSVFNQSSQMCTNQTTSLDSAAVYFLAQGFDVKEFEESYLRETIQLTSTLDSHIIPAVLLSADGVTDRNTAILVHGLNGNRYSVYATAKLFMDNGYNVLAYDQRSSGENTAPYTTYGYWESRDLKDCLTYVNKLIGSDRNIVLWGASFGGGTVGNLLADTLANRRVKAVVMDCPIGGIRDMLRLSMEKMDLLLPVGYMLWCGNLMTKLKLGFNFDDTRVTKYAAKTNIPVLIFNSDGDTVTPAFIGQEIFDAVPHNNKAIYTAKESQHCRVRRDHTEDYISYLLKFI